MSRLTLLGLQLLVAVVALGAWQFFATVPVFGRMLLPPFFFSNPVDVGSQIFDYWRDPDGFLVEHYTDGDMFDNTLETGWAPFTASGLAQWGPPVTKDFLGIEPKYAREELGAIVTALRGRNEFDVKRLMGMLKVARS